MAGKSGSVYEVILRRSLGVHGVNGDSHQSKQNSLQKLVSGIVSRNSRTSLTVS